MSTIHTEDRASLCSFTFVDGRRCRIPRRHGHPYLCTFHARREAKLFAGEKVGEEIARYLSGEYVPAGDLCLALGRLFAAVAQGQVEPKTVAALAHLGRSLVQTLHVAHDECAIASGAASANRPDGHLQPKHRVRLNSQTSQKIPPAPNLSESTLAEVYQNRGF